jgi:hypothetical protein
MNPRLEWVPEQGTTASEHPGECRGASDIFAVASSLMKMDHPDE